MSKLFQSKSRLIADELSFKKQVHEERTSAKAAKEKTPLNNLRKAFSQSLDSFSKAFANFGKKDAKRSTTQDIVSEVKESKFISSLKIRSTRKLPTPVSDLPKGKNTLILGFRDSQELEPENIQEGPKIAKTKPTIKGFALQTQISLKTVVEQQQTTIELDSKVEEKAEVADDLVEIERVAKMLSEQSTSVNLTLLNSEGESEKGKAVDDDYDPTESEADRRKRYLGKLMNGTAKISPEFTDKYILGDLLGDGAFGFVFTATTIETNAEVAVKFIVRSKICREGWVKDGDVLLPAEVATLKKLQHPNIIKYVEHITDEHYILLITELHGTPWDASNLELTPARNPGIKFKFKPYTTKYRSRTSSDLFECIDAHTVIPTRIAKMLFAQIILACDYLHSNGLVHRDIKDENIVVDAAYRIKMIDFGSTSAIPTRKEDYFQRYNGTPHFAAPEIVKGHRYRGPEAEIWALGVLLYTIVFGENPFQGSDDILAYRGKFLYPRPIDNELKNLIENMLCIDPKRRFDLQRVKNHIFAYGQTGSGKTHTMNGSKQEQGIIPRTVQALLAQLNVNISISASYLEIYNEKIYDLLTASTSNLDLRETSNKEIVVAGVTRVGLKTMEDFATYHQKALKQRSTAETKLNESSSRSHFILQLNILQKRKNIELNSKLHLIDLAGSEDNKRTGNSGQRMNESCAINKSLFVLGQVVEGLNKNASRIPYRDSKITRFLQDSLGGNAIGVMIACCSPIEENYIDTFNTLNFAQKSSLIKNTVTINSTSEFSLIPDKKEDLSSRLEALTEWKKSKASTKRLSTESQNTLQPAKRPRLSTDSNNSVSLTGSVLGTQEFEDKVNLIVEQRIKSILEKNNLTQKMQKTKKVLEGKLKKESLNKENAANNIALPAEKKKKENTEEKQILKVEIKDNHDLDALKNSTTNSMLHVLNHGNMKAIMTLKMIGKKRAEAILDAREKDGEFVELKDLERAGLKQSQISSIFKVNQNLRRPILKYNHHSLFTIYTNKSPVCNFRTFSMADLEFETVGVKKRQAYSYKKNPNTREILLGLVQKYDIENKKTVPSKLWEEIATITREQLGNKHENVDKITASSVKTFYRNWKKKDEEESKEDNINFKREGLSELKENSLQEMQSGRSELPESDNQDTEKENKDETTQSTTSNELPAVLINLAPKRKKSLGLPRTPIINSALNTNRFDIGNVSECNTNTPQLGPLPMKKASRIDMVSSPVPQDKVEDKSKYFEPKEEVVDIPKVLSQTEVELPTNAQTVISNLKETPNKAGKVICYLCARAVTKLSDSSKAKHFEKCMTTAFTTVISPKYFKHPISTLLEPLNQCPFCKTDWNNSSEVKMMHLKSCIKHNDIATHSLLRYFKSLKIMEPEVKVNAFDLMKNANPTKKCKKTVDSTKILELQQQGEHMENRKHLFIRKFLSKVQFDKQQPNIQVNVVTEESVENRRKSTLWEMADNKELEIESIPILDKFYNSEAGQRGDYSFADVPPVFEKNSETPFKLAQFDSRLSPETEIPTDEAIRTSQEGNNQETPISIQKLEYARKVSDSLVDFELEIIEESKSGRFRQQEFVNSLQTIIQKKRKELQNQISALKLQFQSWVDDIESKFDTQVEISELEKYAEKHYYKNEISTQTSNSQLSFTEILQNNWCPEENSYLVDINIAESDSADKSGFIHEYNPTGSAPGIYDYSPTLPELEFETVTLKRKKPGDTPSQGSDYEISSRTASKYEIVTQKAVDIPPVLRTNIFSRIQQIHYIPPSPDLSLASATLMDIPPIIPKLEIALMKTVNIAPFDNVDNCTVTSVRNDEEILKPKKIVCLDFTKNYSVHDNLEMVDIEASFKYDDEISFQNFDELQANEQISQADIGTGHAFDGDLGEISQIYPNDIYNDSDISGIEELVSDASNSPLLDRVPVELSLNSDDEADLPRYSQTNNSGKLLESFSSFKRSGGFYDEVGLISQCAFTQADTHQPEYSPNKKLKLEFEWSNDELSDDDLDLSSSISDEDLSIIPCTQFPNTEREKKMPGVLSKLEDIKKSSANIPPNYSAMPLGDLKKIADGYGLKSNTGKAYLVEKLTEIWKVLNSNLPVSPPKVTSSPLKKITAPSKASPMKSQRKVQFQNFDDTLMAHFKKDTELNRKVICFEPLKFEELYQSLLFVPLLDSLPRKVLSSFLDKHGINYIAE
ncbi:Kinesin-like protein kif22 [Boothiomyces sp. JEL0866]|nr:Kinesin-like protein kif22 [Boothiomyces sp. JEL0866]